MSASVLDAAARVRVARLLTLAADDASAPGEARNAAQAARRMLERAGLTWDALLGAGPAETQEEEVADHRALAAAILAGPGVAALTAWECGFLRCLMQWDRPASAKQRAVLARLARKAAAWSGS